MWAGSDQNTRRDLTCSRPCWESFYLCFYKHYLPLKKQIKNIIKKIIISCSWIICTMVPYLRQGKKDKWRTLCIWVCARFPFLICLTGHLFSIIFVVKNENWLKKPKEKPQSLMFINYFLIKCGGHCWIGIWVTRLLLNNPLDLETRGFTLLYFGRSRANYNHKKF